MSNTFKGYGPVSGWFMANLRYNASTRGKHRVIEMSITAQDIAEIYEQQGGKCALSGAPISFPPRSGKMTERRRLATASVDRIDPRKGYTRDNVQLLDKRVNMAKHLLTNEEFRALCAQVTEYGDGKTNIRSTEPPKELNVRSSWQTRIPNA